MLDLNTSILSAVVDQAMRDAAGHPRWLTAITRAAVEILSNPYVARQDGHLLIASPTSGNIYAANGQCQCKAFEFNQPCWHRAAARLVRLHDERQAKAVAPFVCGACHTSDYGPSAMQPAICYECVNAWLHGFSDRFQQAQATDRAAVLARQAAAGAALLECYA
jgi:hypothetical protein